MGKSREAAAEVAALRSIGEAAALVLAGHCADVARTLSDLLGSESGEAWRKEGTLWHIFVDGVDEIAGGAGAFAPMLDSFLQRLADSGGDLARIRLRLLCRTIEWSDALDQTLQAYWSEKDIETRQLLELDAADIREAFDQLSGDPDQAERFVKHLGSEAVALASRPVSFQMLADTFIATGRIEGRQVDLYREALGTLLSQAVRATAASSAPTLDVAARLTLAARIAGATVFSTKNNVWIGLDEDRRPSESLGLAEIAGGYEPAPPGRFAVREADLFDILRSPLFEPVGPESFGWAHKTFEEYLAARYLVEHRLTPADLYGFLAVQAPGGSDGIPAPLREVAAWAAALSPSFFRYLVEAEPDVLLQSDVAAALPAEREALVSALLERIDRGELSEIYFGLMPLFGRLAHPGLAGQIDRFLKDTTRTVLGKRAAIDIAEANDLKTLSGALADLAATPSAPILLRKDAAYAVYRLENDAARARLAPLLKTDLSDDVDDELRGAVLLGAWPDHLSLADLLAALTSPRRAAYIGAYAWFLHNFKLPPLSADDAVAAIRWLAEKLPRFAAETDLTTRDAYARIFWAAAAQTTHPAVRDAMADLVAEAFTDLSQWLFDQASRPDWTWPGSPVDRVDLIRRILQRSREKLPGAAQIQHLLPSLIRSDDLDAYLAALARETDPGFSEAFAGIIVGLTRDRPIDSLVHVWDAAEASPALAAALHGSYFVEVPSAWADMLRTSARRSAAAEERRARHKTEAYDAEQGVLNALAKTEATPVEWWRLNLQMFMNNAGSYQAEFEFRGNLKVSPGWLRLTPPDRERVVTAAIRYLTGSAPSTQRWLGTDTTHRPSAAGYRALRLIREERPEAFATLETPVWETWAHAAISFFENEHAEVGAAQAPIIRIACERAPIAVGRTLARLALGPRSRGISARVLEVLAPTFDATLGALIQRLIERKSLKTDVNADLWAFLVRSRFSPALDTLRARLSEASSAEADRARETLVDATAQLMSTGDAQTWQQIFSLRRRNPDLARDVWGRFASSLEFRLTGEPASIPEDTIGQAYLDLAALFPEESEDAGEARIMTAVDHVVQLRQTMLARLVNLGTAEAVAALTAIAAALPDAEWLRARVREARRNYRAAARRAYEPRDAIAAIAALGPAPLADDREDAALVLPFLERGAVPDDPSGPSVAAKKVIGEARQATPLRILAVADEWWSGHGGVSTLNRELCNALAALGHDVRCVVIDPSDHERLAASDHNVTLVACPASAGIEREARLLLLRNNLFGSWVPDFVLGHDHVTGPAALVVARDLGVSYVHFVHTVPQESEGLRGKEDKMSGDAKREGQRRLGREARLVVGIGPKIYDNIESILPHEIPTHELLPGLNSELLSHATDLARLRTLHCLLSGRMADAQLKGVPLACDAVETLIAEHGWTDAQPWLIIRGFAPGEVDEECSAAVHRPRAKHYLQRRPYTDDRHEVYRDIKSASLVIMPSASEGFGLAAYEAIAAGVPVIVSNTSGLAQYLQRLARAGRIDPGVPGACIARVRSAEDSREWADKITMAFQDRASAFDRAKQLREALRPILTWESAALEFVARLRAVLDGSASTGTP